MFDYLKNAGNNLLMDVSKKVYAPPQNAQFEINGELSPNEFKKAGDQLTEVCKGWKWKPSSNLNYRSKYLDQQKQYLVHEKALCKKRITLVNGGQEQNVQTEDGDEIIILHATQKKQEEQKQEDIRLYTMYIIYDEYYHTPRMFFSATDIDGKAISNQAIKQDIQKQYLDKTLTIEPFPFIENVSMPTVHPCRHANVLKSMSDAMRESGQKIQSQFALLIFLKFITSVIPTVEFDLTGDLHFE